MAQDYKGSPKEKEINWDHVDKLLEAGCSGVEIAPHFGIHFETLYDRAYKKFGIMWSQYSQQKRQKGDGSIKFKQFQKAMSGDNMMLIWLGKNRLKQSDHQQQEQSVNDTAIGEQLELAKLKAENAELKRILNESKTGIEHLPG